MEKKFLSAYLDLLRLTAAAAVALYHIKMLELGPEAVRRFLPGFGHEFVVVFFVLSGYVIAWSVARKLVGVRDYALDRIARIYSVVIPALLISTVVSLAYKMGTPMDALNGLLVNLLFIGQSWSIAAFPPSNPAFWSLCYEVMYYALFGCFIFLRGRQRLIACTVVVLLAGPKVILLLPCWLAGVAAYHCKDGLGKAAPYVAVSAIVVLGLLSYLKFGKWVEAWIGPVDFGPSSHFAKDYVTAILIALHLYAVRQIAITMPSWLSTFAVKGAALTFTLYLIHYPIILVTRQAFAVPTSLAAFVVCVLLIIAATALVGTFTESQRHVLREALIPLLPKKTARA